MLRLRGSECGAAALGGRYLRRGRARAALCPANGVPARRREGRRGRRNRRRLRRGRDLARRRRIPIGGHFDEARHLETLNDRIEIDGSASAVTPQLRERLATADLEEDLELLGRNVDLARRTIDHAEPDAVVGIEVDHAARFAEAKFGLGDERRDFECERRRSFGKHDVIEEGERAVAPGENHCQDVGRISRAARLGPDDMSVAQRQPGALAARFSVEGAVVRAPTEEHKELTGSEMMKASLQNDAHA